MIVTLQIMVGLWRAVLSLPDAELPFNFDIVNDNGKYSMVIHNADERIKTDAMTIDGDSLFIKLPVFESEFRLKNSGYILQGSWINYARKGTPSIPFKAAYGNADRFITTVPPSFDVTGRWEAQMDADSPDSSLAIGVFTQKGNKVTGTFLASGGDHRYLEGNVTGDTLWLSVFDGSHCWLYKGVNKNGKLDGTFWSGNHYKDAWHAQRNDTIALADPLKIAQVTQKISFSFPDADSNIVSLSDDRFKDKVIILQVMGSWCPNCLDETAFLADYYRKHKEKGLEIIGLAFEKTADFSRASANIKRLSQRMKAEYPILFAGVVGKEEVMKKIKGLENFNSYPTTIYINRNGEVVKVYSGFSGPATGAEYEKFTKGFEETVDNLLKYKPVH